MFENRFQNETEACHKKKIIFIKFLFTVALLVAIIFRTEAEAYKDFNSVRDSKINKTEAERDDRTRENVIRGTLFCRST